MNKRMMILFYLVAVSWVGTLGSTEASAQVKAALTRDMDSPIRGVRYIQNFGDSFSAGQFTSAAIITPTVPAGKKLFLQSVSLETVLTDSQAVQNAKVSFSASTGAFFFIPQTFQGAGATQSHYVGNLALNVLLNPGETITVSVFRNNNLGSSSLNFFKATILGYFVDENP